MIEADVLDCFEVSFDGGSVSFECIRPIHLTPGMVLVFNNFEPQREVEGDNAA